MDDLLMEMIAQTKKNRLPQPTFCETPQQLEKKPMPSTYEPKVPFNYEPQAPAECPAQTPISACLRRLDEQIRLNDKLIGELLERVRPILSSDDKPYPVQPVESETKGSTIPLVTILDNQTTTLHLVNNRIYEIIDRLGV